MVAAVTLSKMPPDGTASPERLGEILPLVMARYGLSVFEEESNDVIRSLELSTDSLVQIDT